MNGSNITLLKRYNQTYLLFLRFKNLHYPLILIYKDLTTKNIQIEKGIVPQIIIIQISDN